MNMPEATISFIDSDITPVQVEFPHHVGHYRKLEYALTDIEIFKCIPKFK